MYDDRSDLKTDDFDNPCSQSRYGLRYCPDRSIDQLGSFASARKNALDGEAAVLGKRFGNLRRGVTHFSVMAIGSLATSVWH